VRRELVIIPLILLGLIAAAVAVSAHGGGAAFSAQQQGEARINPRQLDAMLMTTREPVAHGHGSTAAGVACEPGTKGAKLNPWRCNIRYGSGAVIEYLIEIADNGRFEGVDGTGARTVRGCCVVGVAHPFD
jgi:hypothetical protein